jgi:hypothetical protein
VIAQSTELNMSSEESHTVKFTPVTVAAPGNANELLTPLLQNMGQPFSVPLTPLSYRTPADAGAAPITNRSVNNDLRRMDASMADSSKSQASIYCFEDNRACFCFEGFWVWRRNVYKST